jgi:imidazolonepropionase-like amidohydrolase
VPSPIGGFLCLRAVRETGGTAIAVDESAMERATGELARRSGLDICPEGGAAWAACGELRESGWMRAASGSWSSTPAPASSTDEPQERKDAMRRIDARAAIAAALLAAVAGTAAAETLAFTGARLIPIAGPEIDSGTLVVADGAIVAVGRTGDVAIPAGATVRDLAGRVLMPGLVDTHSHLGRGSGGDASGPLQPDVRILDAVDVRSKNFWKARAGGVTTLNVMPGSGHLLSGQTVYLKPRAVGATIESWLVCADAERALCGGIKMANGTNSQKAPPFPGTRGRSAALQRGLFVRAVDYRTRLERAGDDPAKRPDRDLGLEAMVEALAGRRVIHFHTHRHDDIATVLRLSAEFGVRPVLHHLAGGVPMAAEIARFGLPASITVIDSPGGKLEALDASWTLGAALERAGVDVAIHTDDAVTDSRFLLRSAGLAVRGGMTRGKALEALTLAPARMLGLDSRLGSLTVGKDADFVVLSGDPFALATRVEETWIEGVRVYDSARDGRYLAGGPDVYPQNADHSDHATSQEGLE